MAGPNLEMELGSFFKLYGLFISDRLVACCHFEGTLFLSFCDGRDTFDGLKANQVQEHSLIVSVRYG